jgi:hypothetical protein
MSAESPDPIVAFERLTTGRWMVKGSEVGSPTKGSTIELIFDIGGVTLRLADGTELGAPYRDCYFYEGGRRNLKIALHGKTLALESLDGADGGRLEKTGLDRRSADTKASIGVGGGLSAGLTIGSDGSVAFWGTALASSQLHAVQDGARCHVAFGVADLRLVSRLSAVADVIPYAEITHLQVGGRGALTETTGGGFIGGGFGVQGAVEGMLMASALNALTTRSRTTIETIVELAAGPRALLLVMSDEPPELLRTHLSPVIARIDEAHRPVQTPTLPSSGSVDRLTQLKTLGELRDSGVLTPQEFEAEKVRILGS